MSIVSPDIRKTCGQSARMELVTFGDCFNIPQEGSGIKIKYNNTKMLNYTSTGGTYIPVFKTAEGGSLESSCSPYASDPPQNFICGNGINGNVWCHSGMTGSWIQKCSGTGSTSFPVGNYWNCYSQSNDTASNACGTNTRPLGFKNLYATKAWVGRLGNTSRARLIPDDWDWCCDGCVYHSADSASIDNVKYRTISATATENVHSKSPSCTSTDNGSEFCCSDGYTPCACGSDGCPSGVESFCFECHTDSEVDYGGNANATTTIDIYGNIVVASCGSSSYGCIDDGYPEDLAACQEAEASHVLGMTGAANNDASLPINLWCGYMKAYGSVTAPDVLTKEGPGSYTAQWHITMDTCFAGCGGVTSTDTLLVVEMIVTPTSFTLNSWGPNGHSNYCTGDTVCVDWIQTQHSVWTVGNTSFDFSSDMTGIASYSFNQQYHGEVHGSLADPYTIQEVYDDVVNMMALWDFGDPDVYPWRTDVVTTMGPVVRHDEGGGEPYVPTCTGSIRFTGKIKGAPAPIGINAVWDFDHPNYCICAFIPEGEESLCYEVDLRDWGAWSTDCGVPRATCWLDLMEANNMPQGAFVGSSFGWSHPSTCNMDVFPAQGHDDTIWACKYAEAVFPKQSFNYARPCGVDRFMYSGSGACCITGSDGNTLTLSTDGSPTTISPNSYVWVCGTGTIDGCWKANGSGYSMTLTEPRLISASQVASSPIFSCAGGLVYPIRWQPLAPAFCGRSIITSATNDNPVTCSIADGTYLVNGDYVTISGARGFTEINGQHQVSVISCSLIALKGVNGISKSVYVGGGEIYSPFAPDYKWDDITSKNDFTYYTWQFNYRDVGEYNRVLGQYNWNYGIPYDCFSGPTDHCGILPDIPPNPRANQAACGMDQNLLYMTCSTNCLAFDPCRVGAAYFSPNKESFILPSSSIVSSKNCGWMPSSMSPLDPNYQTMWQGIIVQTMNDPYFVAPPCNCTTVTDPDTEITSFECDPNCSWQEDNGSCQTDQSGDPDLGIPCYKFYPARNFYEARCSVPPGAPPLMGDAYLGCLTPAQLNTTNCPKGNICWAPQNYNGDFPQDSGCSMTAYKYHNYSTPWIDRVIKESCVCGNGRFAGIYAANGIGCPSGIVPPP